MWNLKHVAAALFLSTSAVAVSACDDDVGTPTGNGTRRTTSTNCPVAGGGTSSGTATGGGTSSSGNTQTGENTADGENDAIDDGDCTTAGSGTSGGRGTTTSSSSGTVPGN